MESNWEHFQEFMALDGFRRCLRSGSQKRNKETHGSMSTHPGGSLPFVNHGNCLVIPCYTFLVFFFKC